MNEKIKRLILVLVLLLIIFSITILAINHYKSTNENRKYNLHEKLSEEQMKEYEEDIDEYLEDKVIPSGIYRFSSNYEGNLTRNDLYIYLNYIVKCLPDIYEKTYNMDKDKLSEYYLNNSEKLMRYLGIVDESEFMRFQENLIKYDFNNAYVSCQIVNGTFEKLDKYLKFDLNLVLKNDITVPLKIYFGNDIGVNPTIKVEF